MFLECPTDQRAITQLARLVTAKLVSAPTYPGIWINITIDSKLTKSLENVDAGDGDVDVDKLPSDPLSALEGYRDPWDQWNEFRSYLAYDKRVGVALELNGDIPDGETMRRWLGEPIRAIVIPTSIFATNSSGYPVLSKHCQAFIRLAIQRTSCRLVLKGHVLTGHNYLAYCQYLEHLKQKPFSGDNVYKFAKGYEDVLQYPLQPLKDNLESSTYEVFEKDPVKYSRYQDAIVLALQDIDVDGKM